MDTVLIWIEFLSCLAIILVAGRRVARYGDIIAAKTGIGGLWVGLLLLAIVTSLPELFSSISAVLLVDPPAPDLAAGAVIGSNSINLFILAFLDVNYHNGPLLSTVGSRHLLPAGFSMVLAAIAVIFIFISKPDLELGIGWIGIYTPILILLFIFFMRMVLVREREHSSEAPDIEDTEKHEHISLRRAYFNFTLWAVFVIGAGIWLAFIGEWIAEDTGWKESFVGSLFIAFTTSSPEIVVSFAALRLGALDMAVGNIIGSNLFNISIIGVSDLFYREGPVLADVLNSHAFVGLIVLLMTAVIMAGLVFRSRRKAFFGVSWYVPILAALYILGAYASFTID